MSQQPGRIARRIVGAAVVLVTILVPAVILAPVADAAPTAAVHTPALPGPNHPDGACGWD